MTPKNNALSDGDLEKIYETLAHAIDRATPEKETVFLAKLALLLAHEMNDVEKITTLIKTALEDLD